MIIVTDINNKGKRKPLERNGAIRRFPNREAAKQFIRNRRFLLKSPKIESV